MRYRDAKKLHNEDEVKVKGTDKIVQVVGDVEVQDKDVFIRCSDGLLYHHKTLS